VPDSQKEPKRRKRVVKVKEDGLAAELGLYAPTDESRAARAQAERASRHRKAILKKETMADSADIELMFGPMPEIQDPARREACSADLEMYLRTYHPETYSRPFSNAHKKFIRKLQEAMTDSMWIVESVFRGFGKTSITEGAVQWAINNGHKKFPVIIAASARHAGDIIRSMKSEYEANDVLYEDYPEIIHPIRALEGRAQRCNGQRWNGSSTHISWGSDKLVMPRTRDGFASAGSSIYAAGWTSSLRGIKHKIPWSGEIIRPDFVMIDDPQDDELANSPDQVRRLLDVIMGAIIGLGGHQKRISVAILATVIQVGDAIDRMMDAKEFPAWVAENVPMLQNDPEDMEIWLMKYAALRNEFDRDDPRAQAIAAEMANKFYLDHREKMDRGAICTWTDCYSEGEHSALQHAMNIRIDRGEDYFQSECQGHPRSRLGGGAFVLDPDTIAKKITGLDRRIVPAEALHITGFIDVGHKKLNWIIMAFRGDMSSTILDYGVYPDGTRTLEEMGDTTLTANVFRGIAATIEHMAATPFVATDGGDRRIADILVDCGDPSTRDAVFQAARSARFPCRVLPSRGRAHHHFSLPDPRKKRVFQNAYLDIWKGLGPVVVHDACVWRERMQRGLGTGQGGPGCVDIFGAGAITHRDLATQLTSERLTEKLAGTSGEVFKWVRMPGTQNHYLDCAVGCMVAATVGGLRYGSEVATLQKHAAPAGAKRTPRTIGGDYSAPAEPGRLRRGGLREL
jgi:hypothetical protein